MKLFKDMREKHGKHLNTEKYHSSLEIFGPRQVAQFYGDHLCCLLYAT